MWRTRFDWTCRNDTLSTIVRTNFENIQPFRRERAKRKANLERLRAVLTLVRRLQSVHAPANDFTLQRSRIKDQLSPKDLRSTLSRAAHLMCFSTADFSFVRCSQYGHLNGFSIIACTSPSRIRTLPPKFKFKSWRENLLVAHDERDGHLHGAVDLGQSVAVSV